MFLNKEEELMINGEKGAAVEKAMRLLVKLGEIYGAEKMVPIASAQAAGVSYKSIGDPGIEFLEGFADEGAKVTVPTLMNPAGMDLEKWEELGFPKAFAEKQKQIVNAFSKMGVIISSSCTPYYLSNLPRKGEHLAWAESSAVSFANSALGAMTNREGGPSALSAAICGRTGYYGLHIKENRKPTHLVEVKMKLENNADLGLLGNYIGSIVKKGIPYFTGITPNTDQLKALGAAMAASGAVAIYHVDNITPEAHDFDISNLERISFDESDLKETKERLNTGETADCIMLGCPHCSINEIEKIAKLVNGKNLKTKLWVCTAKPIKTLADRSGLTKIIENAGGNIVCDTCMVVSPIEEMGFKTVAVNSGKAAAYLPSFCKQKVVYNDVETLINGAVE